MGFGFTLTCASIVFVPHVSLAVAVVISRIMFGTPSFLNLVSFILLLGFHTEAAVIVAVVLVVTVADFPFSISVLPSSVVDWFASQKLMHTSSLLKLFTLAISLKASPSSDASDLSRHSVFLIGRF